MIAHCVFRYFGVFGIMDSEEVGPDFEIGITDKGKTDESWQSSASDSVKHSASAEDPTEKTIPVEQQEEEKTLTEQQLSRVLKGNQLQTSRSRPRRRRSKRRRSSQTRSISASRETQGAAIPERPFISPSRIAKIFDKKISVKNLCALSALKHGSPTAIHKIMPTATIDQICQMAELWDEKTRSSTKDCTPPEISRANRRPKSRPRKSRRKTRSASSRPVLDRMKDIKAQVETHPKESNPLSDGFPVPTPAKGS